MLLMRRPSPGAAGDERPPGARTPDRGTRARVTARMVRPRWSDARIWGAALLLVIAAILGGLLLGREGGTVTVLQASRDLAAGAPVVDLRSVAVPAAIAGTYLTAADADRVLVPGAVLRWPVGAGDLVPIDAVTVPGAPATRLVSVPVDPLHAPAGLAVGDIVDVWVTRRGDGLTESAAPTPELVLGDALVTGVATDGIGFAGGWGVELSVTEEDVEGLVAASRTGVIDLVTVPASSQAVQQ